MPHGRVNLRWGGSVGPKGKVATVSRSGGGARRGRGLRVNHDRSGRYRKTACGSYSRGLRKSLRERTAQLMSKDRSGGKGQSSVTAT